MNISIFPPLSLHEIGQRTNNEDNIFPLKGEATVSNTLFLVCDGVGGAAKGEVASALACETFASFFAEKGNFVSTESDIRTAVAMAQQKMDDYLAIHGTSAKGMACTLTLLHLHAAGATIAHIGDSRVYHIRGKDILFQTQDHKLVNDLVKYGAITPEQALNHPQRNVITRALQAASVQEVDADVQVIADVQAGDYFFLCSDGILERVTDVILTEILAKKKTNDAKMQAIFELCQGYSKDNFSAYLVQIKEINHSISVDYKTEETLIIPSKDTEKVENTQKKAFPKWVFPLSIFAIVSISIALWVTFLGEKEPTHLSKEAVQPTHIAIDTVAKDTNMPKKETIPAKDSLRDTL